MEVIFSIKPHYIVKLGEGPKNIKNLLMVFKTGIEITNHIIKYVKDSNNKDSIDDYVKSLEVVIDNLKNYKELNENTDNVITQIITSLVECKDFYKKRFSPPMIDDLNKKNNDNLQKLIILYYMLKAKNSKPLNNISSYTNISLKKFKDILVFINNYEEIIDEFLADNVDRNNINNKINQYKKSYKIVKKNDKNDTSVLYLIYFNYKIFEEINDIIINKILKKINPESDINDEVIEEIFNSVKK